MAARARPTEPKEEAHEATQYGISNELAESFDSIYGENSYEDVLQFTEYAKTMRAVEHQKRRLDSAELALFKQDQADTVFLAAEREKQARLEAMQAEEAAKAAEKKRAEAASAAPVVVAVVKAKRKRDSGSVPSPVPAAGAKAGTVPSPSPKAPAAAAGAAADESPSSKRTKLNPTPAAAAANSAGAAPAKARTVVIVGAGGSKTGSISGAQPAAARAGQNKPPSATVPKTGPAAAATTAASPAVRGGGLVAYDSDEETG